MGETFPDDAVMVGRGLVADPSLLRQAMGGPAASLEELREFHDRLYGLYCRDFSGDVPVLHHMRELWNYFSRSFRETDTLLRQVRKAGDCGHMRRRCGSFSMAQSCPIDDICKGIMLYTKNPRFP